MDNSSIDAEVLKRIQLLEEKYKVSGQDMVSYLDGLLYADFLTYWDYIHLDTLLSLQNPKTGFKDERVFIMYHQITELFFKLILWELEQIAEKEAPDREWFLCRITRLCRYFENLEASFEIMVDGMEKEQFLKFRMSLLPSSGFQSAQYRFIEIASTDMINLVQHDQRDALRDSNSEEKLLDNLYWKSGATELATGSKTLTLKQFEKKYADDFLLLAKSRKASNLWQVFQKNFGGDEAIIEKMREYDILTNVMWGLAHYKSAVRYLDKDPEAIAATGGTNWQKYLPPRFQKVIFFSELWSEKEKEEWGKPWVARQLVNLGKAN